MYGSGFAEAYALRGGANDVFGNGRRKIKDIVKKSSNAEEAFKKVLYHINYITSKNSDLLETLQEEFKTKFNITTEAFKARVREMVLTKNIGTLQNDAIRNYLSIQPKYSVLNTTTINILDIIKNCKTKEQAFKELSKNLPYILEKKLELLPILENKFRDKFKVKDFVNILVNMVEIKGIKLSNNESREYLGFPPIYCLEDPLPYTSRLSQTKTEPSFESDRKSLIETERRGGRNSLLSCFSSPH